VTDILRFPDGGRDDAVTAALREAYAAPVAPTYWGALEARVLTRLRGDTRTWWELSRGPLRAGLVAAGIALLLIGGYVVQAREAAARVAVEQALDADPSLPDLAQQARPGAPDARAATLRWLLGH
jgi:hypothetical protein